MSKPEVSAITGSAEIASNLKLEGEGSGEGSRRFQAAQHEFAKNGEVAGKAREAARALEGDQAAELEKARKASADGRTAA